MFLLEEPTLDLGTLLAQPTVSLGVLPNAWDSNPTDAVSFTMRIIVIEGTDGTGTTTHAQSLTTALTNRDYTAISYHHPRHKSGDGHWARSLHYAMVRAKLMDTLGQDDNLVVVADRWSWSNQVCGYLGSDPNITGAIINLRVLEDRVLPKPILTILLDAPDDVLDARLAGKPTDPLESTETRRLYRDIVGPYAHIIDTSKPIPEVTDDILSLALKALGDPRA